MQQFYDHLEISPIELPFPVARRNPRAGRADVETRRWLYDKGLLRSPAARRRCVHQNYGSLMAYAYPRATRESLALCQKWLTIGFFFDDICTEGDPSPGEMHSAVARIAETLESGSVVGGRSDGPCLRALAELRQVTLAGRSPAWCDRFLRNALDFYEGFLEEFRNQTAGSAGSIGDYIALRRKTVGMTHAFDLMEIAERTELPERLYDCPEWAGLRDATIDVIAYINDILGLQKELIHGEVNNLVLVIENSAAVDRAEAVARARALLESRLADYLRLEQSLPEAFARLELGGTVEAGARRCVAGYRDWMAGYLHWHLSETSRYEGAGKASSQELSCLENMMGA
ncbi:hypothetical protein [Nocardia sp. BMG51109]|uniref:terpene synthase family protein n=1 Tax=Nocardia sp. BMG51109 TaxID=1056816 RepID=UPI000462FBFE|nr:hypothetical protein [Nocardia sp. BMG51109]